jgi:23S rRNA (pseudouridine1915-N3)-methyltransferase
MLTIIIVSDGYKHFKEAISEYEKRTQKFVNIRHIKPISHTNSEYIKVKETLLIKDVLSRMQGNIYLLDERGERMSTNVFAELLEDMKNRSENTIFVIGGSYGIDLEVFATIHHKKIRISDFVMPHSLALLVLLEQIYRAKEIEKGSGYHHG